MSGEEMGYKPLDLKARRRLVRQIARLIYTHDTFTMNIEREMEMKIPLHYLDPIEYEPTGAKNVHFEFKCVPKSLRRKL